MERGRRDLAAVEHDAAARAGFLQEACGADAELRREVETLLVSLQDSNQRIDVRDHRPLFRYSDLARFDRTLVPTANAYAATADCGRFLMATNPPDPRSPPITVIVNWPVLLER